MSGDLAALMAVRVQGIASAQRTAQALVVDIAAAEAMLVELAGRKLLKHRDGRLSGYQLQPEGVKTLDKLLADEGLRASDEMHECYDRFMVADRLVKAACATSQSSGFDAGLDQLIAAQDTVRVAVRKVVRCAGRFATYRSRLESCMTRLLDGDQTAFTMHQAESYHQVWWEMHTDLAATLDVEKEV